MLDAVVTALGLKHGALAGGFFGALVSLKFIDGLNAWQRGTTVLAGTVVSAYVSPLIASWLELTPKIEGGVAFLCGLFGMSFTGAVIKAMPEIVATVRERIAR